MPGPSSAGTPSETENPAKPRYSSSFSIDSILSGSRSSSPRSYSPGCTSFSSDSVITSSVLLSSSVAQTGRGHYDGQYSQMTLLRGGVPLTPGGQSAGAFHTRLPSIVTPPSCTARSRPRKRPRSRVEGDTPARSSPSPKSSSSSTSSSPTTISSPTTTSATSPPLSSPGSELEEGHPGKRVRRQEEEEPDTASPTDDSTSGSNSGSPSSDAPPGERRKKNRTSFSPEQISELETTFLHHRYLAAPERTRLARHLELSEQQIKTWFQNRRMKEKRQVKDGGDQLLMATPTSVLSQPMMTSHPMTSHPMTSHPALSTSPSLMSHISASPPMMHASGHVMSHEIPRGATVSYPAYPAPHHVLPASMTQLPVHHHHPYTTTRHLADYAPDYMPHYRHPAYHMPMSVMMQ